MGTVTKNDLSPEEFKAQTKTDLKGRAERAYKVIRSPLPIILGVAVSAHLVGIDAGVLFAATLAVLGPKIFPIVVRVQGSSGRT